MSTAADIRRTLMTIHKILRRLTQQPVSFAEVFLWIYRNLRRYCKLMFSKHVESCNADTRTSRVHPSYHQKVLATFHNNPFGIRQYLSNVGICSTRTHNYILRTLFSPFFVAFWAICATLKLKFRRNCDPSVHRLVRKTIDRSYLHSSKLKDCDNPSTIVAYSLDLTKETFDQIHTSRDPYAYQYTTQAVDNEERSDKSQHTIVSDNASSQHSAHQTVLDREVLQTNCYLANGRITPIMPEASQRYTRKPRIEKVWTNLVIKPMTLQFKTPQLHGWKNYTHPEGARYFFHEELRIYTDADLYDPRIFIQAEKDIATIYSFVSSNNIVIPDNSDLIIDLFYEDSGDIQTTYYLVNHTFRIIFFLDPYDAENLFSWGEIWGVATEQHLRHEIEAQYWYYIQLYPHSLSLTVELVSELRGITLHYIGDSMTSVTSAAPHSLEDLYKILTITGHLEKNIHCYNTGSISIIGRLMYIFAHSRFLDFHGEPHSRLEMTFSVYGTDYHHRSWFVKTISPLLLFCPDFYLQALQKSWVDQIMHKSVWTEMMTDLKGEWQRTILLSIIALNADMVLLAIQKSGSNYILPFCQAPVYASVAVTFGSVISAFFLLRKSHTDQFETTGAIQEYLSRHQYSNFGPEVLAVIYCLPYSLLLWGLLLFFAGVIVNFAQQVSVPTCIILGTICLIFGLLLGWFAWADRKSYPTASIPRKSENNSDSKSFYKKIVSSLSKPLTWNRKISTLKNSTV